MAVYPTCVWPFLESPSIEQRGLVVFLRHFMRRAQTYIVVEIHWIDRAQAQRALEIVDRLLRLISIVLDPPEPTPCPCGIRIECHGALEQHTRGSIIAYKGMHCAEYCQNYRIVATNLCGPLGERSRHRLASRDVVGPIVD